MKGRTLLALILAGTAGYFIGFYEYELKFMKAYIENLPSKENPK